MTCCWKPSPQYQMCSPLGSSCSRANYLLRVVRPEWVDQFALSHDERVCGPVSALLKIPTNTGHEHTKITSTLPLSLGGLGLRSARRTCVAAYWASWADALPMIQERHPTVADQIVFFFFLEK